MSTDNYIWPASDINYVNDDDDDENQGDENQGEDGDCIAIGPGASSSGHTISIGTGFDSYDSCTSKQYVEQQTNTDGDPTVRIHGDLVVADIDGENEINVTEFMQAMKDRMLILQPNFEAMEEYPALKDAYDQYKMLEKLLTDNNAKKD